MSIIFAMKILSDICFYFFFVNFFVVLLGGDSGLTAASIIALSSLLCAILKDRGKMRYIPLIVMIFSFFRMPMSFINFALLTPPIIYVIYNVIKLQGFSIKFDYTDIFFMFLKIAIPFFILSLIFAGGAVANICFPYAFIFILNSILLMRILRHDSNVIRETRFKILNIVPVAMVVIAGFVLSSKTFLNMMSFILSNLYFKIIVPILIFIITLLIYIIYPLFNLLKINPKDLEFLNQEASPEFGKLNEEFNYVSTEFIDALKNIMILIAIGLVIFLIIKLFKKLFMNNNLEDTTQGIIEQRISIDEKKAPRNKINPRTNNIREIYKKFMILCNKEGFGSKSYMTTSDFENFAEYKFNEPQISKEIRLIYIDARYGEKASSRDEIKRMKELYKEIKR